MRQRPPLRVPAPAHGRLPGWRRGLGYFPCTTRAWTSFAASDMTATLANGFPRRARLRRELQAHAASAGRHRLSISRAVLAQPRVTLSFAIGAGAGGGAKCAVKYSSVPIVTVVGAVPVVFEIAGEVGLSVSVGKPTAEVNAVLGPNGGSFVADDPTVSVVPQVKLGVIRADRRLRRDQSPGEGDQWRTLHRRSRCR